MKNLKNLLSKMKNIFLAELLVVILFCAFFAVTYKTTYETEYQKVLTVEKTIGTLNDFQYQLDRTTDDFLLYLSENLLGSNSVCDQSRYDSLCGYAFDWSVCDIDGNILAESTANDFIMIWTPDLKSESFKSLGKQAYLIENYFSKEEMDGFWEFCSKAKVSISTYISIEKVIGFYDTENNFIPTEIVFIDTTDDNSKNTYILKSNKNSSKPDAEYITRKGDIESSDTIMADEPGTFHIARFQKRIDSVTEKLDWAIKKKNI